MFSARFTSFVQKKTASASVMLTGTSAAEKRSAYVWISAFFPSASSTMRMMRETAVPSPTDSTRTVAVPSTTSVPA